MRFEKANDLALGVKETTYAPTGSSTANEYSMGHQSGSTLNTGTMRGNRAYVIVYS